MLYLGCTDSECQGTKCAVGRSVAIATNDRNTRNRDSKLWTDDVDNALLFVPIAIKRNPKFFAVAGEGSELLAAKRILINGAPVGWYDMIGGCEG